MTAPTPESKANEILDQLGVLQADAVPNELRLQALENEARKLVEGLNSTAWDQAVLGAVLCERGRFDEGIRHLKAAVKRDPGERAAHVNLVKGYRRARENELAYRTARNAWNLFPGELSILDELIMASLLSGRITEAATWIEQWKKEAPDRPHDFEPLISAVAEYAAKVKLSDSALVQLFSSADAFLVAKGYRGGGIFFDLVEDEGGVSLARDSEIAATTDTLVDLTVGLSHELIAKALPYATDSRVTVGVVGKSA